MYFRELSSSAAPTCDNRVEHGTIYGPTLVFHFRWYYSLRSPPGYTCCLIACFTNLANAPCDICAYASGKSLNIVFMPMHSNRPCLLRTGTIVFCLPEWSPEPLAIFARHHSLGCLLCFHRRYGFFPAGAYLSMRSFSPFTNCK